MKAPPCSTALIIWWSPGTDAEQQLRASRRKQDMQVQDVERHRLQVHLRQMNFNDILWGLAAWPSNKQVQIALRIKGQQQKKGNFTSCDYFRMTNQCLTEVNIVHLKMLGGKPFRNVQNAFGFELGTQDTLGRSVKIRQGLFLWSKHCWKRVN